MEQKLLLMRKSAKKIYFSHPYSSWERGLNENTNGLLRQYINKGSSLRNITNTYLKLIEDKLNNSSIKTLGYKKSNEVFSQTIRKLNK